MDVVGGKLTDDMFAEAVDKDDRGDRFSNGEPSLCEEFLIILGLDPLFLGPWEFRRGGCHDERR